MADPGFTIEVDDSKLKEILKKLDTRVRNLQPAFEEIGELLVTSIVKNFEVGGRYSRSGDWRGGSNKWQPLSLVTLEKKRGKGILLESNNLLNSINWQADSGGVEVGTNRIYAAIHQFGGKAGRGKKVKIPARPYLVVQGEDLSQINEVLGDYLLGKN